MHWRADDADDDDGGDDDDYDDDDADDPDGSYDDDAADDDDDADTDDDDDVYGHVGSRRIVLVHDFMDMLLLCPPTSLLTMSLCCHLWSFNRFVSSNLNHETSICH